MRRRWQRLSLVAVGTPLALAFFTCIYSVIAVREAIEAGAIERTDGTCLTVRDKARVAQGVDQRMADWWMLNRIRSHRGDLNGGVAPFGWQVRGVMISWGLSLAMSPEDRIARAAPALRELHLCKLP